MTSKEEVYVSRVVFREFSRVGRVKVLTDGSKTETKDYCRREDGRSRSSSQQWLRGVNSQLLISIKLAAQLGFWSPEHASEVILETAGGPLRAWLYPRVARISVVAEGSLGEEATSDIVVSP